MPCFRFREDRAPIAIILGLFALDLVVYATVDAWPLLFAWTLIGIVPKGHVAAWNHHHQHVHVFHQAVLNRALELVYALQTGVTSNTWVLHHSLGHHVNYLDQEKDESRWARADGSVMGVAEYAFDVALTAYPRAFGVATRHARQQRIWAVMLGVTLLLLAAIVAWRPLPALFVFVLPMAISLVLTAWATHSHHAGKSTASHFVACNNVLHRGYNLLTGNLGYHTAHHHRPGVHWSKLPALHAEIAHLIPGDCYLSPGIPWRLGQSAVAPPVGQAVAPGHSRPAATEASESFAGVAALGG
jgi:fatty acid desaturase